MIRFFAGLVSTALLLALASCNTVIANQYEATALVTYTWRVEYSTNPGSPQGMRHERFASTSLLNRNGVRPEDAVTGPDERGLWWPVLPPRPSVDEIEERGKPLEKIGKPLILKEVTYRLTYEEASQMFTLPTNYSVYRQVVKAYPKRQPLKLILGINDASVQKAEPK
ncbi:MAG: hypothetical protein F6K19_49245 [Cyanothece sp. SIO1E1]|nr:hypothetical protein [Cyanothece sp. SIO1E1]